MTWRRIRESHIGERERERRDVGAMDSSLLPPTSESPSPRRPHVPDILQAIDHLLLEISIVRRLRCCRTRTTHPAPARHPPHRVRILPLRSPGSLLHPAILPHPGLGELVQLLEVLVHLVSTHPF